jgi:DNA-binding NarL/FixJ family response regulator
MSDLRVLVADDHVPVRSLIKNILQSVPDWSVCGEAENGNAAVLLALRLQPDIIVMDIGMPEVNGLEATRRIIGSNSHAQIVLTTLHDIPSLVDEARKAGACGCFFKTEAGRHLVPAVRAAIQNKPFFTPDDLELAVQSESPQAFI